MNAHGHASVTGERWLRTYLATDLPDHDDAFRLWVFGEPLKTVDEVGPVKRVPPDTHARALAHSFLKNDMQIKSRWEEMNLASEYQARMFVTRKTRAA